MFNTNPIEETLLKSLFVCKMEHLFEPRFSNISGVSARGGTGADKFFYFTKDDAEKWGFESRYAYPLLIRPRYNKSFTFSVHDWSKLKNENKPCYVFMCHQQRDSLPENVSDFIKWGERTHLVRTKKDEEAKTANESMASKMRERDRHFFGWYDLGDVIRTPIFTSRRSQYRHRFGMLEMEKCALDDSFITFIPKQESTSSELLPELAYLNSDFSSFFIEIYGRSTGGGVIELDDRSAGKLPILNCKKLSEDEKNVLATLFKELENRTREIGGADTVEYLEKLRPILEEINAKVADILCVENELLEKIKKLVRILSDRRISRTGRARPEAVKGEEEPKIAPPKKRKAKKEAEEVHRPLTRWM